MGRAYYYLIASLPILKLDDYKGPYRLNDFVAGLGELLTPEHYSYVKDILCMHDNATVSDVVAEDMLLDAFYRKMLVHPNRFIRHYFAFDLELRNILLALNKRKFALEEATFLEPKESIVVHRLNTSSVSDFGLSGEAGYLSGLLEHFDKLDIVSCELYIDQLRWEAIDSINTFKYFQIDVLLGYLVKLILVERWIYLDAEKGREVFEERTRVPEGIL